MSQIEVLLDTPSLETHGNLMGLMEGAYAGTGYSLVQHGESVGRAAAEIVTAMGYDNLRQTAFLAGLYHDVGKAEIPQSVLWSRHQLAPSERKVMALHPEIGYRILRDFRVDHEICQAALYHHCHYDGQDGYPLCGLRCHQLPFLARVVAVADVFNALVESRLYREGDPPQQVWNWMQDRSGSWFDPKVLKAFTLTNLFKTYQMSVL